MECKGYRFSPAEHLKGETRTSALFEKGKSFIEFPLRVEYRVEDAPSDAKVKVLFSAPKRYRRYAVDRNLMKRRMREAYRLNKKVLYDSVPYTWGKTLCVAFRYVSDSNIDYSVVDSKMRKALSKLSERVFSHE